jgi:hypothetical protein
MTLAHDALENAGHDVLIMTPYCCATVGVFCWKSWESQDKIGYELQQYC